MPTSPSSRLIWQGWRWGAYAAALVSKGSAFLPRAIERRAETVERIGDRKLLFRLAGTRRLRWLAGRSISGDWDLASVSVNEHPAYRSFQRRFQEGAPWEDTPYWQEIVRDVRDRAPRIGCRSLADVERKFRSFDRLWEIVGTDSYRPTGGLRSYRPWEEVLVGLGRRGDLVLIDGRHRLIMAHLKGSALFMLVIVRHDEAPSLSGF